ncbi:MAG: hypothetical protein QME57_02925 [Patescibacteria group bacterium]|nr:hypothetical protein [Patescibacteria group bacterium]
MTKKTRTILFLIFLFLFLLIAPATILYSLGYRFDFENKKLTQTGGFFLKSEPKKVEIYIDRKLAKKTDFFFGSALVENLLPKKYKIEVKKEGYLTWEKKLEIREKEVSEVKNLVLFPKNLNFNILTKGVENFWFSPDEKKIVLEETEEQGWALKLYDLEKKIKSHLISEKEISQKGTDLMNLDFSEDSKELYLKIGMEEQEKTFILKLDKLPLQLVEKKIIPTPENILASQKQNQDVYYLDNSGYVFKNELKVNKIPFPVQSETKYTLKIFQDFLFLIEGENLYLFSPDSKSFEKFFERINNLKISPDNKKLVFFSNSEIWILFLKDEGMKKAGEKLFINRFSEKIDDIFWLNSDYLIFNSGNNLKIVEIDDRDRIQTWDITPPPNFGGEPNPEIYFNGSNRKLYILSQGNLFVSERLF